MIYPSLFSLLVGIAYNLTILTPEPERVAYQLPWPSCVPRGASHSQHAGSRFSSISRGSSNNKCRRPPRNLLYLASQPNPARL